jgi:hypothetical protein
LRGWSSKECAGSNPVLGTKKEVAEILGVNALDIMQFDESVIFNINTMSNSAPNGTVNNYNLTNEERQFFSDQIKSLSALVEKQNKIIEILMKKL